MPHYRNKPNQKKYALHTKNAKASGVCQFCSLQKGDDEVVKVYKHFKIIRNIFPYDNWDARGVSDHLMIVPVQHTENLSTLGDEAAIQFVKLISKYEADGYNIYARSPASLMKSVPHQHTHLIKNDGKRHKALIHFEKPYISITF